MVYNQLVSIDFNESVGVYSCPARETTFPYILLAFEDYDISRNYNYNLVTLNASTKIYDRSESSSTVIGIPNSVEREMSKLVRTSMEDFFIAGVLLAGGELKVYSDIGSVWCNTLHFKIIARQDF
jgi:hypothetical protein